MEATAADVAAGMIGSLLTKHGRARTARKATNILNIEESRHAEH